MVTPWPGQGRGTRSSPSPQSDTCPRKPSGSPPIPADQSHRGEPDKGQAGPKALGTRKGQCAARAAAVETGCGVAEPEASRRPVMPKANITGTTALPSEVTWVINSASGIASASSRAGSRGADLRTSSVTPRKVDPARVNRSGGTVTIQPTSKQHVVIPGPRGTCPTHAAGGRPEHNRRQRADNGSSNFPRGGS
jgi:hypothetical protein